MIRQLHGQEYAALKVAFGLLVREVGGVVAAEHATGYPASHLSEAASLSKPERMPRIDHVADLERLAGRPLATVHLARLAGHLLVPMPDARGAEAEAVAGVLRGAGELGGRFAQAMGDGALDDGERAAMVAQAAELQRAAAMVVAVLSGPALKLRAVA